MKKILIIEDDPSLQKTLVAKLKASGYQTVLAGDGEEAIKVFKKEKPALILCDLILPKKSGLEVIEEIKINQHSEVPLIVLSNLDQAQDLETAKRLGAVEYILKSDISLRDLIIRIDALTKEL